MKKDICAVITITILVIFLIGIPMYSSRNTVYAQESEENYAPWPCFGGNAKRTGQSPYDTSHVDGTLLWRQNLGRTLSGHPVIGQDDTIYIGSLMNDRVYAISPQGTIKWSYVTGDWVWSSPVVDADGTIYIGSDDGNMYAIGNDGTLIWKRFISSSTSSPIIGSNGTIYIGSNDGNLYSINPDGTENWRFRTGDEIWSSPALANDGTIYVGSLDKNIYAVNPDGTLKWFYTTGDWITDSSPAIGLDGTIYIGSLDKNIYAVNPDGTLKWHFTTGDEIYSSPTIGADGTIYIGSLDNNMYALNQDGTLKWHFTTDDRVFSSPAIGSEGTIYVGSNDNNLYAITPDGTIKWRFGTQGGISSSPAIGRNGTIYFGSQDGYLYAIGEGEGVQLVTTGSEAFFILLTVIAGVVFGVLVLFLRHKKLTGSRYHIKRKEEVSKTVMETITSSADLRAVMLSAVLMATGLYLLSYSPDDAITQGYRTMPYRTEGFLMLFFGVFFFVIGSFIKRLERSYTDLPLPLEDHVGYVKTIDEPVWVTIKHTKDLRVMALGMFIILFGLLIFVYGPWILFILPFFYYLPWDAEIYILIGMVITIIGMFKNKREPDENPFWSSSRRYTSRPGMKRCPQCNETAMTVEKDDSAFCENCDFSTMNITKEIRKPKR